MEVNDLNNRSLDQDGGKPANDILGVFSWKMYALVDKIIIDSDNGLAPVRHQAIIWTKLDYC